ncbi:hypothetical protein H103_07584, partial [Trichophyton rubrum CBS 288.86]
YRCTPPVPVVAFPDSQVFAPLLCAGFVLLTRLPSSGRRPRRFGASESAAIRMKNVGKGGRRQAIGRAEIVLAGASLMKRTGQWQLIHLDTPYQKGKDPIVLSPGAMNERALP